MSTERLLGRFAFGVIGLALAGGLFLGGVAVGRGNRDRPAPPPAAPAVTETCVGKYRLFVAADTGIDAEPDPSCPETKP